MAGGTLGGKGGRKAISEINITPMVDVVLVLLVIMMVSANYIVSKSLKVELPQASSGADSVPSVAAVVVTAKGDYYFNQEPVDEKSLTAKLKEAHDQNPDVNLIVSADKSALHGSVVHVVDLARGQGIAKFAINVEDTQ